MYRKQTKHHTQRAFVHTMVRGIDMRSPYQPTGAPCTLPFAHLYCSPSSARCTPVSSRSIGPSSWHKTYAFKSILCESRIQRNPQTGIRTTPSHEPDYFLSEGLWRPRTSSNVKKLFPMGMGDVQRSISGFLADGQPEINN